MNKHEQAIANYFQPHKPVKTGEARYPGGKLILLEVGEKAALVNKKLIFRNGRSVARITAGWAPM